MNDPFATAELDAGRIVFGEPKKKIKRMTPVEVLWDDAHGGDEGWREVGELDDHLRAAPIRTVGLMARRSKAGVVVILSLDRNAKRYGGYVFIPTANIVSLKELR